MSKSIFAGLCAAVGLFFFLWPLLGPLGFAGTSFAARAEYTIRVGHVLAPTHPYQLGLEYFKELMAKKTGGRVNVEVFHSSRLGNERDLVEGLQRGTLEMTLISTAPLAGFTSDFLVFNLPFVFSDVKTARACVDSEIGQKMLNQLSSRGIVGLCYFENGFRSVTNSKKPIAVPEDLNGMKIRTMENPIHMDSFRAMKANPTPMPFGELFTALRQKTIDAQENPLAIVETSAFYEVQEYLSLTEHFYAPSPVLMAKAYYDSLPADVQAVLKECLLEARAYERGLLDEMNARLVKDLAAKGMKVNAVDKTPFVEAVQVVYEQYTGTGPGKIPAELIRQVKEFKKCKE
ncbi:MAG: TRAP transporter substrate-binding protein [Synergistaceae bacterium]|jgi:tripartite ATP-independent transporter DctP family solute receptor|nr:TRAP transporter substrate-binding protein [Synergistaceae bacterium]